MKKDILKNVIVGCFVTLMVVFSVPVIAQAADEIMEFNRFRIKTATGDIVLWGENYIIDDGNPYNYNDGSSTPFRVKNGAVSVPSSISYGGTMYIQIDALGKIFDKYVLFNGDTDTITLLDFDPTIYGSGSSIQRAFILDSVEMVDTNGVVWKYNVLEAHGSREYFMVVVDEARGFSYAYKLADENSYEFTDEGVYITKYGDVSITQTICRPVPAEAQTGEFNRIRIIFDNEIIIEHGEKYILADGNSVPVSISYSDTVYFQVDAFCQIFDKTILWNGDSSTITFLDFDPSGINMDVTLLYFVEMADANGNIWNYSVFEVNNDDLFTYIKEPDIYFMVITDEARGFSRAYRLAGKSAYEFTDDCVYLAKLELIKFIDPSRMPGRGTDPTLNFSTILYENTPNSQDGDEWVHSFTVYGQLIFSKPEVFIDNGISYYMVASNNRSIRSGSLYTLDFKTGERTYISIVDSYLMSNNLDKDLYCVDGAYSSFVGFVKAEDGYLYFEYRAPVSKRNIQIYEEPKWIIGEFKVKTDGTEEPIHLGFKETVNPYKH